jgi:hypothetical protein
MTDAQPTGSAAAGPGAGGEADVDAGVAARERLARQLRETRLQLAMTQQRLNALEQSSTMVFGRTVANVARRPWPRAVQLPRDLYRLWRERGLPKSGAGNAASALAAASLADLAGTGEQYLSALTAPGVLTLADPALALAGGRQADTLVITGALSPLGCATLAPDAMVHPLLPHDADVLLEGTGADLVIIEAAAMLPGAPWAYATDPAAADRGRRLARMIVMARSLGKPVVFVANVPQALMPGAGWVAAACDAVVDDGLGVQLARFNPVGLNPARPTEPLYAAGRDPREAPGVRALLDQLTGGPQPPVRLAGARGWRALPALYREHAVFLTASPAQAREQLACGARVVGPLAGGGTGGSTGNTAGVRAQLEEARAAGPLDLPELRVTLRDVFAADATAARLAAIARAAGLPAGLVGGRRISVLATAADAAAAGRLARALLSQRLRPAEVVVAVDTGDGGVGDALGELSDHGVRVVTVDAARGARGARGARLPDGPDWPRPLARFATCPWLAPWAADATPPDTYLLDLACARECAQADAVGFGAGEYEFTRWLDSPALVRADLLGDDGPAVDDWGRHGLRLITITAGHRQGAASGPIRT